MGGEELGGWGKRSRVDRSIVIYTHYQWHRKHKRAAPPHV